MQEAYAAINAFILDKLPSYIPSGAYRSGTDEPGEEDFHLVAWLTRITPALLCGDMRDMSYVGLKALGRQLGRPVPEEVMVYCTKWADRESWKNVYIRGMY